MRLTLYSRLRPGSRQQAHSSDHEILEGLVASFRLLAHVFCKARNLGGRVVIAVLEGTFEFRGAVVLPRYPINDVGFVAPLLRSCQRGR